MQVKYFPKLNPDYSPIPGQSIAYAILTPDTPRAKYILEIAVHGVGERSGGTLDNLKNLVLGFDYNGDGIREGAAFVTDDMKKAVDQYGIIMIIPTYEGNTFFEPAKVNTLYDWAVANYPIYPKMLLTGFSYGGGAVVKYISSSLSNAQRVAYAVPCAAVNSLVDASLPGKANVPVHFFANNNDPTVSSSNTKSMVSAINASNPTLKAIYTEFDRDGHGGNIEAWSLTPPKAPGGTGFTDAAENIYQVATDCILNGPRQMKSGSVITPLPQPDPTPIPVALTADFNLSDGQLINAATFEMDASNSTGVKPDWDGYKWDIKPISPVSSKAYGVRTEGGAYGGPKKKLIDIVDGIYEITLTVKNSAGNTAQKRATITARLVGTPVKTVTGFDSATDLITYSDGTTEKGSVVLSNGAWVLKNSSGQIVNL